MKIKTNVCKIRKQGFLKAKKVGGYYWKKQCSNSGH